MFFWKVSRKPSRRGSGAKIEPTPSKITLKKGPAAAKVALGKSKDFQKENTWKTELESTFLQKGAERDEP